MSVIAYPCLLKTTTFSSKDKSETLSSNMSVPKDKTKIENVFQIIMLPEYCYSKIRQKVLKNQYCPFTNIILTCVIRPLAATKPRPDSPKKISRQSAGRKRPAESRFRKGKRNTGPPCDCVYGGPVFHFVKNYRKSMNSYPA